MAKFKLTLPTGASVCDGKQITFKAPMLCEYIEGIVINDTTYDLVDANGEYICDGCFSQGAMISVVLDTTTDNEKAYLLNSSLGNVQFITWGEDE